MRYTLTTTFPQQAFIDELNHINLAYTALNLRNQSLFKKSGAELAQAFGAIPVTVNTLHLSANGFNYKSGKEMAEALAGIPPTVTTLDLSDNSFGNMSATELAQMLAAIPPTVTILDLSGNIFCQKSEEELAQMFAAIHSTVTTLDISRNSLGFKQISQIIQVLNAIPQHVRFINAEDNGLFGDKEFVQRSKVEIDRILKGLQDSARFNFKNNNESDLVRALNPIGQAVNQGILPEDMAMHVLSFLPTDANPKHRAKFNFFELALHSNTAQKQLTELLKQTNLTEQQLPNFLKKAEKTNFLALHALSLFINKQCLHLQEKQSEKGAKDKLQLFTMLQEKIKKHCCSGAALKTSIDNYVYQAATIAHHQRHSTMNQAFSVLTLGLFTNSAASWEAYQNYVKENKGKFGQEIDNILQKSTDMQKITCEITTKKNEKKVVKDYEAYRTALLK